MSNAIEQAFASCANTMIKNLNKRNMEGYYCENSEACRKKILDLMPEKSIIAFGGSETFKEIGLLDQLRTLNYQLIDRSLAKTPEEHRAIFAKTVLADYYFMSTNAITLDGELVNIDGNGNRAACLIHGPEHVMIIVGRQKVVETIEMGISRSRNIAAAANAKRLNRQTPCNTTGHCNDCLSPDCMCNHIVVTRHSGRSGRIKVFLVNEVLGY